MQRYPAVRMHCRPYANNYSPDWVLSNMFALVAGAMIVNQLADYITELKLGNGTSVLIFANIASYLPSSVGAAFAQADKSGSTGIAVYMLAFLVTTFGIVCVQVSPHSLHGCSLSMGICLTWCSEHINDFLNLAFSCLLNQGSCRLHCIKALTLR